LNLIKTEFCILQIKLLITLFTNCLHQWNDLRDEIPKRSPGCFLMCILCVTCKLFETDFKKKNFCILKLKIMKTIISFCVTAMVISFSGCGQSNSQQKGTDSATAIINVGGGCEGCEAVYETPVPFEKLSSVVTLPDFKEPGPRMEISGIIYKADGKTPAPDVVLYIYHTDQTGKYTKKGNETGWGKRHGYIRGWVRSNAKGEYKFYTLRPAPYPGGKIAAHIHPVIKEPGMKEYWIDEFVFDDDPMVTAGFRNKMEQRGGSGVIKLHSENGLLTGHRDIILGLHIPGYSRANSSSLSSGLEIGSSCPAFGPLHISGPDAGKKTCPMCKYGYGQGVMVWLNNPSLSAVTPFAIKLENEIEKRGLHNFRVFIVYIKPTQENEKEAEKKLTEWSCQMKLKNVAVVMVPSVMDAETAGSYKINPSAKIINTVFVYKKRQVAEKFINIDFNETSFEKIMKEF
jgi:protocatechuate 3,4-dioxygenase beta subunit